MQYVRTKFTIDPMTPSTVLQSAECYTSCYLAKFGKKHAACCDDADARIRIWYFSNEFANVTSSSSD